MRIAYACPACATTATQDGVETAAAMRCPACAATLVVPPDAIACAEAGRVRLRRCLVCPGTELFARKDFPQRLGVGIVVAGFAASCLTWGWRLLVPTFAILFGTALLDVVLYLFMPECLVCYRCAARYSGDGVADGAGGFDLETHEKHRQTRARLTAARTSAPDRTP